MLTCNHVVGIRSHVHIVLSRSTPPPARQIIHICTSMDPMTTCCCNQALMPDALLSSPADVGGEVPYHTNSTAATFRPVCA